MATTRPVEKALKETLVTDVIEEFVRQSFPSAFGPYVYNTTKLEKYDEATDTATISVTVDIENVTEFLREFTSLPKAAGG